MLLIAGAVALAQSLEGPNLEGSVIAAHGYELVEIQPGRMLAGPPEPLQEHAAFHRPHRVTLKLPYRIGKTEVTWALWEAVMGDPGRRGACARDTCPAVGPNWHAAVQFCNELSRLEGLAPAYAAAEGPGPTNAAPVVLVPGSTGYRLPTEAEWEFAARAGREQTYAGSDDAEAVMAAGNELVPVGQLAPNPWGLHDMSGNAWEWVWDWFGPFPGVTLVDPTGPEARVYREVTGKKVPLKVTRGGSVTEGASTRGARQRHATVWRRQPEDPAIAYAPTTGLRVVRSAAPSE